MFLSVFGHFNVDIVIEVKNIPDEGSIDTKNIIMRAGGTARNICAVAGSLGVPVEIFSKIGKNFPKEYVNDLKKRNVNIENLIIDKKFSFSPVCYIVSDGTRQIAFMDQGPMERNYDFRNKPKGEWIHFSTGNPDELIKIKEKIDGKISFDPGQEIHYRYDREKFIAMAENTEILFFNEIEYKKAKSFTNDLFSLTKRVIVTLGEKGCMILEKNKKETIPAFKVKAKESIGAGDAFRGGFYAGLYNKYSIKNSCIMGNWASSIVVSKGNIPKKFPENFSEIIKQ